MPPQVTMRERLRRVAEAREALRRRVEEARAGEFEDDPHGETIVVLGGESGVDDGIPSAVRSVAAWSWRFLTLVGAIIVLGLVIWELRLIVFPVIAALLLAALLSPAVQLLRRAGVPRALAAATVFIGGLAVVGGVFTLLTRLLTDQLGDISDNVRDGIAEVRGWLATGPLDLSESQIDQYIDDITQLVTDNQDALAGGAIATATVALEVLTGILLAIFTTFFFLYDGERIWRWCAGLFPRTAERAVLEAGRRAWRVLMSYVRATVVIAAVDAIGIGIVLAVVGVPLAVPLAVLVFFGAFVPIVGATVTGAIAVLVALVTQGPVAAVIILAGVIGVQQLEGHILQPLIMGRFVRIHPLAVVLAVAVGAVVAGVWGAVVSVPLAAVLNTVLSYFASLQRAPASGGGRGAPAAMRAEPPPGDAVEGAAPAPASDA
jgi:predicted PurR-regulated permease PerM